MTNAPQVLTLWCWMSFILSSHKKNHILCKASTHTNMCIQLKLNRTERATPPLPQPTTGTTDTRTPTHKEQPSVWTSMYWSLGIWRDFVLKRQHLWRAWASVWARKESYWELKCHPVTNTCDKSLSGGCHELHGRHNSMFARELEQTVQLWMTRKQGTDNDNKIIIQLIYFTV